MAENPRSAGRTLNIVHSPAVQALEQLQEKTEAFEKSLDDARKRQKELTQEIEKTKAAQKDIEGLSVQYNSLQKKIGDVTNELKKNAVSAIEIKNSMKNYADRIDISLEKQERLNKEIAAAESAGKSTVRLQTQLKNVADEITVLTAKYNDNKKALDTVNSSSERLSNVLGFAKTKAAALKAEIKEGESSTASLKKLEGQYNSLQKEIDKTTGKLRDNKRAQEQLDAEIKSGIRPTLAQQETLVRKLYNELKHLSEDSSGFAKKFDAYRTATAEFNRMKDAISGVERVQKSWLSDAKTVAFGVAIGNTVQSTLQAISSYTSGIVAGNAKLSDSLSDIDKATGLSSKQVEKLNKDLGSIDTRTKAADLREIAVGLGQISQEANKANVEAIDKIVVALGDEFGGGAREITTVLSVLRNNLDDIKTGNYAEDVLKIGNALNVAGAEGLATAPVVTDIANRIAGVARTFKLSSGQILGVAATFQELGIETERGSTAITKIFQKIGQEPEKFAKLTKLSAKEFKDLVNRDMLAAFQLVAEGASKAGANNVVFSHILDELGTDGAGAGEVLSKLGKNSELLADKVESMNHALTNGDSILEEFKKKNTNLAAELEKLEKALNSIITSKTLADVFAAGVRGLIAFIGALKATPQWLRENQVAIYLVLSGLSLMNLAYLKAAGSIIKTTVVRYLDIAATKLQVFWDEAGRKAKVAYWIVVDLLTKRIALATAAQELWVYVMRSSLGPIGIVITLIGVATAAYALLANRTKTLTVAQERANLEMEKGRKINETWVAVQETANSQIAKTVTKLQDYAKAAADASKPDAERKKAIQGIIDINPEYFKGLDLEAVKTGLLKTKVEEYTEALKAHAQQKAIFDKRVELEQKKLDLEQKLPDGSKGPLNNGSLKPKEQDRIQIKTAGEILLNKKKKEVLNEIAIVDGQIQFLDKKTEELKKKTAGIKGLDKEDAAVNPFPDKDKTKSKIEELLKQLRDFKSELDRVGKIQEESEIDRITHKYNELTKKAAQYGVSVIEIEKAKNRAIKILIEQEAADRRKAQQKAFVEQAKKEYDKSLVFASEYFDELKNKEGDRYTTGQISKTEYEENIKAIDRESRNAQIRTAEEYSAVVKEAAEDVNKFKKQKRKEDLDAEIKDFELKKELQRRAKLAAAEDKVILTRPGTKANLDAQLELLRVQRDQALAAERLTEDEKKKIRDEYRLKELDIIKNFYIEQINQTLSIIQSALSVLDTFNQARSVAEKAAFDKEMRQNDEKKRAIEKLAKNKVISEIEAKRRIRQLDIEADQKKEALEKKQFERQKRLQIAQAIINGAMAITSVLSAIPGPLDILSLGFARGLQLAFTVATTAAQIAAISSSKYATGGKVKKLKNGRINEDPNIPEQENGDNLLAFVRQGEVILNEDQQKRAGGPDFFKALGVPGFADGGRVAIGSFWNNRPYHKLNVPEVKKNIQTVRYGDGVRVGSSTTTVDLSLEKEGSNDLRNLMTAILYRLNNPVTPVIDQIEIPLNKIEGAQQIKKRIFELGAFK